MLYTGYSGFLHTQNSDSSHSNSVVRATQERAPKIEFSVFQFCGKSDKHAEAER